MIMKNTVFWDVIVFSPVGYRRFGGTHYLHIQGRRESKTISKQSGPKTNSEFTK
jgi:hypothetical protein